MHGKKDMQEQNNNKYKGNFDISKLPFFFFSVVMRFALPNAAGVPPARRVAAVASHDRPCRRRYRPARREIGRASWRARV